MRRNVSQNLPGASASGNNARFGGPNERRDLVKRFLSAFVSLALGVGIAVAGTTAIESATESTAPPAGQCVVDVIEHPGEAEVSHQEYRYLKVTPGQSETTRTEYRFATRVWIENKKEIKEVKGYDFVAGGTTRVNGQ